MAAPARILHLHSTFSPGGKEARAVRLMNRFGKAASHVIVSGVIGALGARAAIDRRVDVRFPLDAPLLAGPLSFARFKAIAAYMRGFDLVLTYNWGAMDAVMAHRLFAKSMQLPPLIHAEDGFNEDEAKGLKRRRNLYRMAALASARALVVPSRTLEAVAKNAWRVPASTIHRIPNGIPVTAYARTAERWSIPGLPEEDDAVVVGTVAGLRRVKDLPVLVHAVAMAETPIRLVIVGEGDARGEIEAEARKAGIADRLLMPGHLADPARYIGHFDIFALSSLSEQFPIALVEAMAAGLPVAATDVGDVRNMLPEPQRRFLSRPGDAAALSANIDALAADMVERSVLGAGNRAHAVAEFDEDAMVARYARLYGDAMGRPDFAR